MDKEKFEKLKNYVKKSFVEVAFELTGEEFCQNEDFSPENSHKLVVIIGIIGEDKGRILFECSKDTAEKFSFAMNQEEPLENKDEMYMYIAEFANMVCGKAATYMNDDIGKREVKITPPVIFSGENLEVVTPNICSQIFYYKGDKGSFLINTGIEEKKKQ